MFARESLATSLKTISRCLSLSILLSLATTFWANGKRNFLPPQSSLVTRIEEPPSQEAYEDRAFTHHWHKNDYVIYPVAEYEIAGLVVTRNDIGGFSDIYHTSDSVDVVDVCLLWGDNAREAVYRNYDFWSEPFSCWYRPKRNTARARFSDDALSNTHVLAKDESLAKRLNSIHLGDQIRLRGKLINYHPAGASEQLRRSSLTRKDTGNGACEVMYVEEFELLKSGNPGWNRIYELARCVFLISIVLKIISLLAFPYLEFRFTD